MSFYWVKNKNLIGVFLILCIFATSFFSVASAQTIEQKHRETKAKINKLKMLENLETNKLYKNQQRLENASKDLEYSKKQYSNTKQKLSDIEAELAKAVSEYNVTLVQVRKRIRNIYKYHRANLFEAILTSSDINSLLDKIYFQNVVAKADKNSLYNVRQNAKRIAQIRYRHEMEKRRLASSIQDINYQQKSLQSAIDKNEALIKKLRTDRLAYERAERELARQSKNLTNMINKSSTSSSSVINVASGFIKPCPGGISSPFGWRVHPIFKSRTFHSGIDIASSMNTSVRASNSGKVIYVGWYGGYGKVVIIDHGLYNGKRMTTLYAHLNSYSVSLNQYVARGAVIARVGTTGYSTGPHLHFEVRCNGQTQNPMLYL